MRPKQYPADTKATVQAEVMRTGQPCVVAKRWDISPKTVQVWYNEALEREEDDGSLGTWAADDIEAQLVKERLSSVGAEGVQYHSNFLHLALFDDDTDASERQRKAAATKKRREEAWDVFVGNAMVRAKEDLEAFVND